MSGRPPAPTSPDDGIRRWSIVIVDLDPTIGHEQAGSRRAVVVSRDSFHRSGMATICPITTRAPKYPGEVTIPTGVAGQTLDGVVTTHQVRTIDLQRIRAHRLGGSNQVLGDPAIRRSIRIALAHHFGLDLPGALDGAA